MGWASKRRPHRRPSYLSQASCAIVSGFTAALDLDTYPLRNVIRPRCAERAKHGRGKPVLIMHIGFLASFHDHSYLGSWPVRCLINCCTSGGAQE